MQGCSEGQPQLPGQEPPPRAGVSVSGPREGRPGLRRLAILRAHNKCTCAGPLEPAPQRLYCVRRCLSEYRVPSDLARWGNIRKLSLVEGEGAHAPQQTHVCPDRGLGVQLALLNNPAEQPCRASCGQVIVPAKSMGAVLGGDTKLPEGESGFEKVSCEGSD